jgi:NAD(P)-dependent dehydrogenase (short-subunit alcohol dehydrogenase family)
LPEPAPVAPPVAPRVAIVTGASAGIGLYTALGLAGRGFRVIMVGRDRARTEAARRLVARRGGQTPDIALADFGSLAAVRGLADELLAQCPRIDVLVNNAGLISPRRENSADAIELTLAVNHLAPFLLTNLLLDRLKASTLARIVTVASAAHKGAWLDPATMTDPPEWTPLSAYGRSKLCNILFTRALARRLEGTGIVASCLHPGVIATQIGNRAGGLASLGWRIAKPFLKRPGTGAATSLFLATVPDPAPYAGAYVVGKAIAETDPAARDDRLGEQLWTESARLVGL